MSSLASHLWSTTLLLVGLALTCLVLVFVRRGAGVSPSQLRLLARLPLDARHAVYLVRVGEKRVLVLGAGVNGLSQLTEVDVSELPDIDRAGSDPASLWERVLAARPNLSSKLKGED